MSIPSKLGHLAMPINFVDHGKNQMAQESFQPGTFRPRVLRSAFAPHWLEVSNLGMFIIQCGSEASEI